MLTCQRPLAVPVAFPSCPSPGNVSACVLKVNVKCCSGCENGAKRKLQRLPGVSAAEYNVQKGLMTVTGNVDPMTLKTKGCSAFPVGKASVRLNNIFRK
ncbi:hypothetical protein Bca52824_032654 [Brassica carinata]|uniref:HMA domain-containing protein n=1 Tax=Brassica carinata TaxID=52824 RepID=A0A8X7SD17_BRACI|nr:hypothetical protein Bca52824_032654 [Brassica carinata]